MLVLERVPILQSPVVPLKPQQILQLPLVPAGAPISFGRGRDCTVRTDGPGVQAELELDAHGEHMALTFRGTMPAPGARTTAKAPHGLCVVTPLPDEFFPDGRLKTRVSTLTQVTGTYALKAGETIVFTLHAGKRTCFTVRKLGANERAAAPEPAAPAPATKRSVAVAGGSERNVRQRTRSSHRHSTDSRHDTDDDAA